MSALHLDSGQPPNTRTADHSPSPPAVGMPRALGPMRSGVASAACCRSDVGGFGRGARLNDGPYRPSDPLVRTPASTMTVSLIASSDLTARSRPAPRRSRSPVANSIPPGSPIAEDTGALALRGDHAPDISADQRKLPCAVCITLSTASRASKTVVPSVPACRCAPHDKMQIDTRCPRSDDGAV
jgi:hypothetical protein